MNQHSMSRSTAVLITFLMMIGIAILTSSCGTPQTKYKGQVVDSSVTRIVYDEPGYNVGDTILIQLRYTSPKFVIRSIIK